MKKFSFGFSVLILSVIFLSTSIIPDTEKTGSYNNAEWSKITDPRTGHEVWQITSHDSISEAFYFYAPSFTKDDRYVIFRSKRSGRWEVYRCDLDDGSIIQLTDEGVSAACVHPDGVSMVYLSDWKYYRMNLYTLDKEVLFDFEGKLPVRPSFRPTLTNDGRYTLLQTTQDNVRSIYRVDLEKKEILMVHRQEKGSLSHVLINPEDPGLITYSPLPDTQNDMTLPMHERPRTRIIRLDKGENEPYLITPYGYRATHDSWSPQGDRFFFFEKSQPGWTPVSIASIDLDGEDYTRHYTCDLIRLGHGAASQDGKWFVTDGQKPFDNPLILINLADGRVEYLCWPDASVNTPARVHVHPNFSFSADYIVYTSDVIETDKHQVFVVPIRKIKEAW